MRLLLFKSLKLTIEVTVLKYYLSILTTSFFRFVPHLKVKSFPCFTVAYLLNIH
jgi:hypothetical protein